jgi:hypothetical protein
MAFNIMDLFAAPAMNRLLQPQQSTVGVPNMLLTRPAPQSYPVAPVPATDPMQTAAVAPPAPVAAPASVPAAQPAQPGLRDQFANFVNSDRGQALNDLFTGWAAGSTPSESLAYGAKLTAANKRDREAKNETVAWLKGKGLAEDEARRLASSPPALNEYLKGIYEQRKPLEIAGKLVDPTSYKVLADFSDPDAKLTSDQREYKAAQSEGYKGSFMDYQRESKHPLVSIDNSQKLPSGYRWKDPANQNAGVEPIPGGPGEQLPGELAARIGMADNFINNDLPSVRESIKAGDVTGPIDRFSAANSASGKPAEAYRKIQSGVEVLSRLLSGAGMTKDEIAEKAGRYMPSYTDTTESLALKMDQLEAELKATKDAALRGRGGPVPQSGTSDPLGLR